MLWERKKQVTIVSAAMHTQRPFDLHMLRGRTILFCDLVAPIFFPMYKCALLCFRQKKVCTIMGFYVPYDIIGFLFVVWTVHMYSSVPVNCTMEREKQDAQQCRAIILVIRV
jgi:hypothetical protein